MALGTVGVGITEVFVSGSHLGDVRDPFAGAALFVQLAALASLAFFMVDLVKSELVGWRRIYLVIVVALLTVTMIIQSNQASGTAELVTMIGTSGHVLAGAAWLGGLVALATVLVQGAEAPLFDQCVRRFWVVTVFALTTVVVTGGFVAMVVAGGLAPLIASPYGIVLFVKLGICLVLVLLARRRQLYSARLAFRWQYHPAERQQDSGELGRIATVLRAEMSLAFAILVAAAILLMIPAPS